MLSSELFRFVMLRSQVGILGITILQAHHAELVYTKYAHVKCKHFKATKIDVSAVTILLLKT